MRILRMCCGLLMMINCTLVLATPDSGSNGDSSITASRSSGGVLLAQSRFLPTAYFDADVSRYFLQKGGFADEGGVNYFHKRYFVETNWKLGVPFYAYAETFYHLWEMELQAGMGQTPNNAVFDPMDVAFGIVPMFEVRLPKATIQLGLEHRCFHEIDRKEFLTRYYNRVFVGFGSSNYRIHDLRKTLAEQSRWLDLKRFAWYGRAGWYVKQFPGIDDSSKVNYNNESVADMHTACTYVVYTCPGFSLLAHGGTLLGYWNEPTRRDPQRGSEMVFWQQDFGMSVDFPVDGVGGIVAFVKYTRDHLPLERQNIPPGLLMPRYSRDQLLQIGVRFAN